VEEWRATGEAGRFGPAAATLPEEGEEGCGTVGADADRGDGTPAAGLGGGFALRGEGALWAPYSAAAAAKSNTGGVWKLRALRY